MARKTSSRALNTLEAMTQRGVDEQNQRIYLFTLRHGPTHASMHYGMDRADIEKICLDIETKNKKK